MAKIHPSISPVSSVKYLSFWSLKISMNSNIIWAPSSKLFLLDSLMSKKNTHKVQTVWAVYEHLMWDVRVDLVCPLSWMQCWVGNGIPITPGVQWYYDSIITSIAGEERPWVLYLTFTVAVTARLASCSENQTASPVTLKPKQSIFVLLTSSKADRAV